VTHYIQAILTVLSLVNPVICAAIFGQSVVAKTPASRAAEAGKAILVIGSILCLAALVGAQLLSAFSISLPAFQTAGGMVLAWMGFIMLRGDSSPTSSAASAAGSDAQPTDRSLTPLILFAASPGTITGVITLSVAHSKHDIPVTALTAIVVALLVTFAIMLVAGRTSGHRQPGLLHDVTTRFMGLIVLAMGVQFALTGLVEFLHE
jgi:multiple antibiotic resistance protein